MASIRKAIRLSDLATAAAGKQSLLREAPARYEKPMETLLIVCDCIALVGLMLWVIQNEDRGGGAVTGLFRYKSAPPRNPEIGPSGPARRPPGSYRRPAARR